MKWHVVKTYYVVILNILTGILTSISSLTNESTMRGTYFVFGVALIVLPILMLFDKNRLQTYVQILTIFDGFIALTGFIILISGFVEIFLTLLIIGLYAPATYFGYEILKQQGKK